MRVKLLIELSGARDGAPWPARGEEVELPDEEAALMCANGYAEPVASRRKAETRSKD